MARRSKKGGGGIGSGILAFFLLACLIEYVSPVLFPIAVGVGIVIAAVFVINIFGNSDDKTTQKSVSVHPTRDLRREIEILKDCQNLVNESKDLETVGHRYNMLVEKLQYFASLSDAELKQNGISFGKSAQEYLNEITNMKSAVLCQAIERAGNKCREHIRSLSTIRGKENALQRFYDNASEVIVKYNWHSPACVNKLDEVRRSIQNEAVVNTMEGA